VGSWQPLSTAPTARPAYSTSHTGPMIQRRLAPRGQPKRDLHGRPKPTGTFSPCPHLVPPASVTLPTRFSAFAPDPRITAPSRTPATGPVFRGPCNDEFRAVNAGEGWGLRTATSPVRPPSAKSGFPYPPFPQPGPGSQAVSPRTAGSSPAGEPMGFLNHCSHSDDAKHATVSLHLPERYPRSDSPRHRPLTVRAWVRASPLEPLWTLPRRRAQPLPALGTPGPKPMAPWRAPAITVRSPRGPKPHLLPPALGIKETRPQDTVFLGKVRHRRAPNFPCPRPITESKPTVTAAW